MRDNDGRKLDHTTLEAMRVRAVGQIEKGARVEDVADALGLNRSSVFKWVAAYHAGGKKALKAKPVPGRPPKLSPDQTQQVYEIVAGTNPAQHQLDFGLWTRDLIRTVIATRFGIELSLPSVGRLLHKLGMSPQRPLHRAWQSDPAAVAAWRETDYPGIAANAKAKGAVVYFGDEASVRSDYHSGTTWGVIGKTPIITTTGARFSVNMISAVSAQGRLRFSIVNGTMTAARFLEFCQRLLRDEGRPVVLIVDGHAAHKAKKVRAWVDSTQGRFTLAYLPAYSPFLNPDEWVWKNVKADRVGKHVVTGPDQFKALAVGGLRRLQRLPGIVRGFFADPNLAYINAAA
jgi:transposase